MGVLREGALERKRVNCIARSSLLFIIFTTSDMDGVLASLFSLYYLAALPFCLVFVDG
jgi:hypothetical protein